MGISGCCEKDTRIPGSDFDAPNIPSGIDTFNPNESPKLMRNADGSPAKLGQPGKIQFKGNKAKRENLAEKFRGEGLDPNDKELFGKFTLQIKWKNR